MDRHTPAAPDGCTKPSGLSQREAARLLLRHGPNEVASVPRVAPLRIFLRQFASPLIVILAIASAVAALLGEFVDAAAIIGIVILNGLLGFVQEWRAERAIDALRDMLSPVAHVIRDGIRREIPAVELVPGDLIFLSEGEKVPADLVLNTAFGMRVDESALTGESVPVDRSSDPANNALFMGTLVVGGRGEGLVVATGGQTRFGQIAHLTQGTGEKQTRLQRQLTGLGRSLGLIGLSVAAMIFLLGFFAGRPLLEMLLTSISMAVAVVPEGLPLVVTLTLAIGATSMARQKAVLRKLQAAETLGAASVICTDKTGTLTENKMTAITVAMADRRYDVTGVGYDPTGHIEIDGRAVRAQDDAALWRLCHAALACNDAQLARGETWQMIGDPTEGALTTLSYKAWAPLPDPGTRIAEIPFTSERKRMATLAPRPDGALGLFVKGAPEAILSVCEKIAVSDHDVILDDARRAALVSTYEEMAGRGLRVIAIADRDSEGADDLEERDLVLLGFVGLLDPPRREVAHAIRLCRDAGVRVLMITGDSPDTAAAVADMVGINHDREISGAQLEEMSEDALAAALREDILFARTAPVHKMRIVSQLQRTGEIVAMTGDGVNDAPALRKADIGLAMGQRGTDVAKEVADLVILDDNFATIVRAIAEGRRQFDNIRKFVRYLLSSNSAEMIALSVNLVIGGPLILMPIHLLWINLLTDSVSAVALGLEPAEDAQMQHPPLAPEEPVLTSRGAFGLAAFGIYMAAVCVAMFYWFLDHGEALARTMAFSTLVFCQEVAVFAFRSERRSAISIGFFSNPWLVCGVAAMLSLQALAIYWPSLQRILGTVALGPGELVLTLLPTLPVMLGPTLFKLWRGGRTA